MDDAFDALVATAVLLVTTLYALQAAALQSQPNPTLNGYEQQLVHQTIESLQHDPELPSKINNTMLQTHYSYTETVVELAGGQAVLEPPIEVTGQLEICMAENAAQRCAVAIIGGSPQYTSCYTDYTLANNTIAKVTACLA